MPRCLLVPKIDAATSLTCIYYNKAEIHGNGEATDSIISHITALIYCNIL